jgi:pimeloyl-ACP methyl ester carboxylesterase
MDVSTFTAHRKSVTAPGGEISYTEFGAGPTALFVHGVGTGGLLWRHVIEAVRDTSRCIAVDLPLHGGAAGRDDMSATAMAGMVAELCESLGLGQVDLVGNDTGGAVSQIFAAQHPELIRSLTLTNSDTEGNFPPPEFAPIVAAARQGKLAELTVGIANDLATWAASPAAVGYEHPDKVPAEVVRAYYEPLTGTLEQARDFERMLAALDESHLVAVGGALRGMEAPTLLVWGTADTAFGIKWAYQLRDMIPGAREVIEVDGAKLFFPEERPWDLIPHLRRHWGGQGDGPIARKPPGRTGRLRKRGR